MSPNPSPIIAAQGVEPTYSAREAAVLLGRSYSWLDQRLRRGQFVLPDGTIVQPLRSPGQLGLAGRVGTAIQVRQKELKLTAQQLAERTKILGYPISRVAISKIEGNKRAGKFDVAELLVLAQALELRPVSLLFPDAPDQDVEILPGSTTSTLQATAWFSGDPGLIWPRREVADLTEKLNTIDNVIARMTSPTGFPFRYIEVPTAEADVKSNKETE